MLKSTASKLLQPHITSQIKTKLLKCSSQANQTFRTNQVNPENHSNDHLAQFYELPPTIKKPLFATGGIPASYESQTKTFNETCLMIRKPALDVINCLKSLDYTKPPIRFVLYGPKGSGKSLSLAHILHYAFNANYLIVHVPWVGNWMRRAQDYSQSELKPGYIDLNLDAAAWLKHFKLQNAHLLSKPEFQTSREHVWSKRESTPKGVPLLEMIEHGLTRVKYASSCVVVLAEEVRKLSELGVCRTLVAVDGFNAFYYPNTRVYTEKKEMVHPSKVTLTEAFVGLTSLDWRNSAVVVTVDEIAAAECDQKSHLPRYLLGKDGFEHLDPFVPIEVQNYSAKELTSCMDYFRERKWVQPDQAGLDEEVAFVSGSNPYSVMQICASL